MPSHAKAVRHLLDVRDGAAAVDVPFVSPILAALLAALATRAGRLDARVRFPPRTLAYARTIGLDNALACREPGRQSESGHSYSALTRLDLPSAIEACSGVINDFVYEQLGPAHRSLAEEVARVVGELHDNVGSHAGGVGFSAAQLYPKTSTLELAIVDAGRGMLPRVQRKVPSITSSSEAIRWCLEKGNTTAGRDDEEPDAPPAQWMPEDAIGSPFPPGLRTRTDGNHHQGIGLWRLSELVRSTGGSVWIWTGDAQFVVGPHGEDEAANSPAWSGLAIEVTLPLVGRVAESAESEDPDLEDLARRLGI